MFSCGNQVRAIAFCHILRKGFNDLIKKYKSSGSLFDLGAGWGHFMLAAKELGYDIYGVEIAEQPYLYCKNDLNLPMHTKSIPNLKQQSQMSIIHLWCF